MFHSLRRLAFATTCATGLLFASSAPATAQVWVPPPPDDQVDAYLAELGSLSIDLFGADHTTFPVIFYWLDESGQVAGMHGANYNGHACAVDIGWSEPVDPQQVAAAMGPADELQTHLATISQYGFGVSAVSGRLFAPGTDEFNFFGAACDIVIPGVGPLHALVVANRLDAPFVLEDSGDFSFFAGGGGVPSNPCADPNNPQAPGTISENHGDYPCDIPDADTQDKFCKICQESSASFEMKKSCMNTCCNIYRGALVTAANAYNTTTSTAWATYVEDVNVNCGGTGAGIGASFLTGVTTVILASNPAGWIAGGILLIGGSCTSAVVGTNNFESYKNTYCVAANGAQSTYDLAVSTAVTAFIDCMCACCEEVEE